MTVTVTRAANRVAAKVDETVCRWLVMIPNTPSTVLDMSTKLVKEYRDDLDVEVGPTAARMNRIRVDDRERVADRVRRKIRDRVLQDPEVQDRVPIVSPPGATDQATATDQVIVTGRVTETDRVAAADQAIATGRGIVVDRADVASDRVVIRVVIRELVQ